MLDCPVCRKSTLDLTRDRCDHCGFDLVLDAGKERQYRAKYAAKATAPRTVAVLLVAGAALTLVATVISSLPWFNFALLHSSAASGFKLGTLVGTLVGCLALGGLGMELWTRAGRGSIRPTKNDQ
jgi:ribosomal protein L37E